VTKRIRKAGPTTGLLSALKLAAGMSGRSARIMFRIRCKTSTVTTLGKTVQARLRHASAKTTLDTYGHLWPDRDESTRATVEAVFAAPGGTDPELG
jgi:integrase